MIPVSLSQMMETLLGAPVRPTNPAVQSDDFSSLLAGATSEATDPPGDGDPQVTQPVTPAGSSRLPTSGGSPTAAPTTGLPQLSQLPLPQPSVVSPARGEADDQQSQIDLVQAAVASVASQASTESATQLPGGTLEIKGAIGAEGAKAGRTGPAARGTKADTATSSISDPQSDDRQDCDPGVLTMQQALAAVASLATGPSRAEQSVAGSKTSPSPAFANTAAPITRAAGPPTMIDTQSLDDLKASDPSAPTLTPIQSHNVAQLLEQHGLTTSQLHRADSPAVPITSSHVSEISSQSQSSDLHQLDALVRDIAEVSGANGRAALRLTADQLGPLEIKLHRSDAGMAVTIRTESEQSHSTVFQAQQQLSDDMRNNGLKVAATSVTLGHGGAERERHDRQHLPLAPPIEASASETDQSETQDERRPAGRYA